MLAEHSGVLSVFEFFNGLDMVKRFGDAPMTGEEFANLISQEHPFVTMVLRRGFEVEEITYPFGPNARYQRTDPLPWLCVSTLPRLTDDPDSLFDETVAFAKTLECQAPVAHYRALFGWWMARLDKRCWVERSGSSIDYLESLHRLFPEGRFVHLHRDGPETALSMRNHHAYRLAISLMNEMPASNAPTIAELREVEGEDRSDGDAISRMLASEPPAEYFGKYWSQELLNGAQALSLLRRNQLIEVRFEDLIAQPEKILARIGQHLELPADDGWPQRGGALVRGAPPSRLGDLSSEERARLVEACRPGAAVVGRSA
jgi:hypothetical protein